MIKPMDSRQKALTDLCKLTTHYVGGTQISHDAMECQKYMREHHEALHIALTEKPVDEIIWDETFEGKTTDQYTRPKIDWWYLCQKLRQKKQELSRLNEENKKLRGLLAEKSVEPISPTGENGLDVEALKREICNKLVIVDGRIMEGKVSREMIKDTIDYLASRGLLSEKPQIKKALSCIKNTLDKPTFIDPAANCKNLTKCLQEVERILGGKHV